MTTREADVAIVGSGISATLVARSLARADRSVVMIERGRRKPHAEQLRDGRHVDPGPGSAPNHEPAPGTPHYPWSYLYAVGGASLHWVGTTPRFIAEDLRMRSEHGVMTDWPIDHDELAPFYQRAERALGVAGGEGRAMAAHPLSPMDRTLAPVLRPFVPLPQARPTRATGGRPACCGSATCELCPVDARFSVPNGLGEVLEHPRVRLETELVASRVRWAPGRRRAVGVEALTYDRRPVEVRAPLVVLAAGGFENPALLLRSGLERQAIGRYLFDHAHRTLLVRLRRDVGAGKGSSLSTGASEAFRRGRFRSRRSGAYVSLFNPGRSIAEELATGMRSGRYGAELRRGALDRWRRTAPLDILTEDVPRPERRVSLSSSTDSLGLPRIRVSYPGPSRYERDGYRATVDAIVERVERLGLDRVEEQPGPRGGQLIGTCRMGTGREAVVDADLRYLDAEGLYVVGSSAFPTYSVVHPTLTIAALAIRLGEHLARERS